MCRLVWFGLVRSIVSFTLVSDISDISGVSITNAVSHNLGTTIGKSHTVFARGSISITFLIGSIIGTRVVISDGISEIVHWGCIISGFMVRCGFVCGFVWCGSWVGDRFVDNSGFVDYGSWVVNWGRFVGCGSWVVDRGWLVISGGGMIDGGGFVVSGGWVGSVVDGGSMVGCMVRSMVKGSMVGCGVIDWGRVVRSSSMVDGCGFGNGVCGIFFFVSVLVDFIRGSSGLRNYFGSVVPMGTRN